MEVANSPKQELGEKCLHVNFPATANTFKSIYIWTIPANTNGRTVDFYIYYPTTNDTKLTVRFWEVGESQTVNVYVSPSNNTQHISITISDELNPDSHSDYRLQLFVYGNNVAGEYWMGNVNIQ